MPFPDLSRHFKSGGTQDPLSSPVWPRVHCGRESTVHETDKSMGSGCVVLRGLLGRAAGCQMGVLVKAVMGMTAC